MVSDELLLAETSYLGRRTGTLDFVAGVAENLSSEYAEPTYQL